MSKFIIENRTDIPDETALRAVLAVVQKGRISNKGKQYCYATTLTHGSKSIVVWTDRNARSERFVIEPDNQR
jgi:hypothetical protein